MSYIDLARAERRSVQRTGLGDRRRTGMPSILRDERSAEAGQIPPDLARPMRQKRKFAVKRRCMNQPVAQRLSVELWWGVRTVNIGFSAAEWGDRASCEAHCAPGGR